MILKKFPRELGDFSRLADCHHHPSLNEPGRSLGPAIVSGEFTGLGIYLTAPFIEAFLALPVSRLIQGAQGLGRPNDSP